MVRRGNMVAMMVGLERETWGKRVFIVANNLSDQGIIKQRETRCVCVCLLMFSVYTGCRIGILCV